MFVTVKELKDILFCMNKDANDKIVKVEFTDYEKDNIGFIKAISYDSNIISLSNDVIIYDGAPIRSVSEIIEQFNITDQDEVDKLFIVFNHDIKNSVDMMKFYKFCNLNELDLIKKFESSIVRKVTKNLISGKYCIYIDDDLSCSDDQ